MRPAKSPHLLRGLLIALFWLGIWQAASMLVGKPVLFASPLDTLRALAELLPTPDSYSFNLEAREPRCAIGQVGPLEYVVVVVDTITHHDRSGKEGATSAEVAQFLLEEGCVQAYNLDGGNSSLMVYHGENYSDKTFNEERSVSDIIYFSTGIDFGLELD